VAADSSGNMTADPRLDFVATLNSPGCQTACLFERTTLRCNARHAAAETLSLFRNATK